MKICPRCHAKFEDSANVCNQDGTKLETVPEQDTKVFDDLVGKVLAGRFKILSKIGQGGMGAVYKAEQIRMGRVCAIKVIPHEMAKDRDAIDRFDREAKMSALINDQHAVTVYDFGETEDGMYFLAMEFVEGETLSTLMRREGILPLSRVIPMVQQACQALHAAHSQAIVHRDLKPDNIMISKKEGRDFVKILDFGIAKISSDERRNDLTRQGLVVGTPLYMSPEQLSGEKIDPRSDIYSFALIVYQMLSGGLPFDGDNAQALMIKRLTDDPLPIRAVNPNVVVPPNVEAVLLAALARDPNRRTSSIKVFSEQFIQAANAARVSSSPPATSPMGQGVASQMQGYQTGQNPSGSMTVKTPNQPIPYQQPSPQPMPRVNTPQPQQPFQPSFPKQPLPPQQPPPQVIHNNPYPPPLQANTPARPMQQPFPAQQKKSGAGVWIAGILLFLFLSVGAVIVVIYLMSQPVDPGVASNGSSGNNGTEPVYGGSPDNTTETSTALSHYNQGVKFIESQDYQSAAAEFRAALTLQPVYPEAQENLAISLYYARDFKEAVKEARKAVKLYDNKRANSYDILGRALYDDRQYMEAAQAFRKALELDASDVTRVILAAFALDLAGESSAAQILYAAFLEKYPDNEWSETIRGIMNGEARPPAELPK